VLGSVSVSLVDRPPVIFVVRPPKMKIKLTLLIIFIFFLFGCATRAVWEGGENRKWVQREVLRGEAIIWTDADKLYVLSSDGKFYSIEKTIFEYNEISIYLDDKNSISNLQLTFNAKFCDNIIPRKTDKRIKDMVGLRAVSMRVRVSKVQGCDQDTQIPLAGKMLLTPVTVSADIVAVFGFVGMMNPIGILLLIPAR